MRWPVRLTASLVITLGLLTWGASYVARSVMQSWFERDLTLRAELAINGARLALTNAWTGAPVEALRDVLVEIAQDERVLGVAACRAADFTLIAATPGFPSTFACDRFGLLVKPDGAGGSWHTWTGTDNSVLGGTVHITAAPIRSSTDVLGYLILIHDLGFVSRRQAQAERLLLVAFAVLALTASTVTLIANRVAWWRWTRDLRLLLGGGHESPEFRPLMRDVRALADRIAADRDMDRDVEAWTPKRLRDAATRHFNADQVIIVANREPYIHQRTESGGIEVKHPASGLVTALEPVMRACSGVWISHGSGNADRETADEQGHVAVPPDHPSYTLRRLWLSDDEERGYYYGFANEGLWALCHTGHTRPMFRTDDWKHYEAVNRRFADAVADEASTESPVVLVQDYHFALLPRLIRERLPRATIIMFWHIPWPTAERFGICPQREHLLAGMLGADILGFHTQAHCNNFTETVERYLEARTDKERGGLSHKGRMTFVRPYPISIEWPPTKVPAAPSPDATRAEVFAELGLSANALLGVGVDRLDYTKGIEERLLAVDRLLTKYPEFRGRFVFLQIAAPSRSEIERYQQLSDAVDALVARINDRWGTPGYQPIIYRRRHHEPEQVYRLYRAADLCYVSSIHDGMNLVAKEFVSSRDDDDGVLVLSQFTGAALELTEAVIVNPYDIDQAGDALAAALEMPPAERRTRMHYMRAHLAEFNVYRWAGRMLIDAARLRKRESLWQRLAPATGGARNGGA
ncbi:MAG: trehalose-6-phosphate synthase [Acidobacteria bacterium]|nr:MAG: trehalose-6-phosphate synthase [Acidobacteriota bacterium]